MPHDQGPKALTIGDVLPTLSTAQHGRPTTEPVDLVVASPDFRRWCASAARHLALQEATFLGAALPTLSVVADDVIDPARLPVRVRNRPDKFAWRCWGDLAATTPQRVLAAGGVGALTLELLLAHAVEVALAAAAGVLPEVPLRATAATAPPVPSPAEPLIPPAPLGPSRAGAQVGLIGRWAAAVGSRLSLAEFLAGHADPAFPPDVAEAVTQLSCSPWSELSGHTDNGAQGPQVPSLERQVTQLWTCLGERDADVLRRRVPPSGRDTLQRIGERHGLTKERVRQIEDAASRVLTVLLDDADFAETRWAVHAIRHGLGLGVPCEVDDVDHVVGRHAPAGVANLGRQDVLLLVWLAGPYRLAGDGWLRRGELPTGAACEPFVGSEGRVDVIGLASHLRECGLNVEAARAWSAQVMPTHDVNGVTVVWTGAITDKLARVLGVLDEPATVDALLAIAGEQLSVLGTRARLLKDDRFARVSRNLFALRAWDMPEYQGIVASIVEVLDHRDGEATDIDDLIDEVTRRYGTRRQSVAAFLSAPMFVTDANRRVRLRRAGDLFDIADDVASVPGVTVSGPDRLEWSLEVDGDHLRGSGRPARVEFAGWAGVRPGHSVTFTGPKGDLRLSWSPSSPQPAFGTVRTPLLEAGAEIGSTVCFCLDRHQRTLVVAVVPATAAVPSTPDRAARPGFFETGRDHDQTALF